MCGLVLFGVLGKEGGQSPPIGAWTAKILYGPVEYGQLDPCGLIGFGLLAWTAPP